METRWQDKGDFGAAKGYVSEGLDLYGYDAAKKVYVVSSYNREGALTTGSLTVEGNTWRQTSTRTGVDGKVYQTRYVVTFTDDGKRMTMTSELSADGTTWTPTINLTMVKVGKGTQSHFAPG